MKCKCSNLPDAFYLDDGPKGFEESLARLDSGSWIWLGECRECGMLWAIDEWDKYHIQVVSRVESRATWESSTTETRRKKLLLENRGGVSEKKCIWAGCDQLAVLGSVYCIDHLYATGARK